MFSRSSESTKNKKLNLENRAFFDEEIKKREKYIIEQIKPYAEMTKAVFIGITGCGKSSVLCSLSHKELLITGVGKIMHLEGIGIGTDLFSYTSVPCIEPSLNLKIILVDCPGFDDISGVEQEILNIFSIQKIFENYGNHENKFKIILVISRDDIKSIRGENMVSCFSTINKMFKINDELKNSIGVVVTKTESDYTGFDYFFELNDTLKKMKEEEKKKKKEDREDKDLLPECLFDICEYLVNKPEQIFTFPQPSFKQKGQQYDFEDHERLLEFLNNSDHILKNPDIKIALSKEANLELKILRKEHSDKLVKTILAFCEKVYDQLSKETKADEIIKWYDIIIALGKENIHSSDELKEFLKKQIPNSEQYDEDIKKIAEYELFDNFIDSILFSEIKTSSLNEVIRGWCNKTSEYLLQYYRNTIKGENQEQLIQLAEQKNKEFKEMFDKLREEEDKKIQEYKDRITELMGINKTSAETLDKLDKKLQLLEQQLKEKNDNINSIQRQLQEERNKPAPKTEIRYVTRTVEVPSKKQSSGSICLLI